MLISNCEKHIRESLNKRFRDAGFKITTEQWVMLIHLGHQDGISQQDLADRYNRSKVSALHLIRKLKKEGYVLRKQDPIDGRIKRIYLTPKGYKTLQILIPLAKSNREYMSRGISAAEIETLKNIVRKITKNLTE